MVRLLYEKYYKPGHVIIDDVGLVYEAVEVFKNSIAVVTKNNHRDLACEIMTFKAMENEVWYLPNIK